MKAASLQQLLSLKAPPVEMTKGRAVVMARSKSVKE
jgi:hypothetical protein